MNRFFPEIHKNFGFGCMRFPMAGERVDEKTVAEMVDTFLAAGFNYFDTARPYHGGESERVVRRCLTSRHPREAYVLTDKLSYNFFETEADIAPLVEDQLKTCGVEYFDFYLIHANSAERNPKYEQARAYETLLRLKEQGKIHHMGMSFHDSAQALDRILTDHPELEVVQLQFNYADFEDPRVQSRACYEVCRAHGKPVFVMEPVKGGSLVCLPPKAQSLLTSGSAASYAIRFAAGFENIAVVLSGMSDLNQMRDNLSFMQDFQPLSDEEQRTVAQLRTLFQAQHRIPCTACRYCVEGCPAGIEIPELFTCLNELRQDSPEAAARYAAAAVKANACLECGQCEDACPQHLAIRQLLKEVDAAFRA